MRGLFDKVFDRPERQDPFDRMVAEWEGQVAARYYDDGEIIGDERMEAFGYSLGLDEVGISDAFVQARINVDSQRLAGEQ